MPYSTGSHQGDSPARHLLAGAAVRALPGVRPLAKQIQCAGGLVNYFFFLGVQSGMNPDPGFEVSLLSSARIP